MIRTIEVKLYLSTQQETLLGRWLKSCSWLHNHALAMRKMAYSRRNESVTLYAQFKWLTKLRSESEAIKAIPVCFARDALRRVEHGMRDFFRRVESKSRSPGFPRFRSHHRYNSMEYLEENRYLRTGNKLFVPKLGLIWFRGGDRTFKGKQKSLRILRRASGWFAQVVFDDGNPLRAKRDVVSTVGIDVGLSSFLSTSEGEKVNNPCWTKMVEWKLKKAQRRLSRRRSGSANRLKAIFSLRKAHEKISAQRRSFFHALSRSLVNRYDLIGFEKLNISGLARSRLGKSILDAAWGTFLSILIRKAEDAGCWTIGVDPRGTSQECPNCGEVNKKALGERTHSCGCGCVLDRDVAAAKVILSRALGLAGVNACGGIDQYSTALAGEQVSPTKQEAPGAH